jgi:hypothetical protein
MVAHLVEALRYKLEIRGFDYHWLDPSGRTMALGSTQPQTEMSNRNISWEVRKADNLTAFMFRLSWNLGALSSCNLQDLSRPVQVLH